MLADKSLVLLVPIKCSTLTETLSTQYSYAGVVNSKPDVEGGIRLTMSQGQQKSQSIRSMQIEKIDSLNLFLLALSAIMAIWIPFEGFIVAYAVVGPLH